MKIGLGNDQLKKYDGILFVNKIKLLGIYFSNIESAIHLKENWERSIDKLERNLTMWSRRHLTLFGKVTIIKTFGISQFVYTMKSIGLPLTVLQRINKMLFSFIWGKDFKNGRTFEKIRRSSLCDAKEEGGLSMIDIVEMQKSFYIKWALKLLVKKDERWAVIPRVLLKSVGGERVFLSNVDFKQFKGLDTIKSNFWCQVLNTWLESGGAEKFLKCDGPNDFSRILCNNKNLNFQRETLYLPEAMKRGIVCVADVMENAQIISFENYLYKVGGYSRAALDYNIISNVLLNTVLNLRTPGNKYIENAKALLFSSNKFIRNLIRYRDDIPWSTGRLFWERKFQIDVLGRYTATLLSTKEIRLRELNFKIFHNILSTNIMLQKMKIKENNKCDFCGSVDFIEHALVTCERLNSFWHNVIEWIKREIDVCIPHDNIIFKLFGLEKGDIARCPKWRLEKANHVLIIAKFVVVKSRYIQGSSLEKLFESEIEKRLKFLIFEV